MNTGSALASIVSPLVAGHVIETPFEEEGAVAPAARPLTAG